MDKINIWEQEIDLLKSILKQTELVETVKWGTPVFTYKGKNVLGIAGFKNHLALWFYNGVFMKDEDGVLVNAQDGKTKALRQWRFTKGDVINEQFVLRYVKEAIDNEKEGKVWRPERSQEIELPLLMVETFDKEPNFQVEFSKLTFYKRKEYVEYIQSAKRDETKIARIEKIKPMILQGIGLHDKYKNS